MPNKKKENKRPEPKLTNNIQNHANCILSRLILMCRLTFRNHHTGLFLSNRPPYAPQPPSIWLVGLPFFPSNTFQAQKCTCLKARLAKNDNFCFCYDHQTCVEANHFSPRHDLTKVKTQQCVVWLNTPQLNQLKQRQTFHN